ncbi:MAG TPA: RluA family pseudouridine synthase [Solirubrobacteraceae bacterium]|nr:RluA family pseudouridine synthase [Solirubrobacteraceae bacterium]
MAEQRIDVPPEAAGERLDAFLAAHAGSRSQAARLIAGAQVSVDGRARPKRHVLDGGEVITIALPEPSAAVLSPTASTASFRVALEDEALLVIDKPAGVVVHPGRGNWEGTLAQALGLDLERGGIVHRLDKDTSGLLVVARTETVQRALQESIRAREVHREYLTLVTGRPESRSGTIDAPLGRDRHNRLIQSLDTDSPREARTHFEIVEALPGATLLRVRLETGRTHQIRVHMQAIGHPVCGDPAYGGANRYGLTRQFLHAARLAFTHPLSGGPVDVSSPLPEDLAAALELARTG